MKREDLKEFIFSNGLLATCFEQPGIYAITIDDGIVYIGQSKNVF